MWLFHNLTSASICAATAREQRHQQRQYGGTRGTLQALATPTDTTGPLETVTAATQPPAPEISTAPEVFTVSNQGTNDVVEDASGQSLSQILQVTDTLPLACATASASASGPDHASPTSDANVVEHASASGSTGTAAPEAAASTETTCSVDAVPKSKATGTVRLVPGASKQVHKRR